MSPAPTTGPMAATFLDLPAGSPGGSVELFLDLYTGDRPLIPARAFMLGPSGPTHRLPAGLDLLSVTGKCLQGPGFGHYVAARARLSRSRSTRPRSAYCTYSTSPSAPPPP